eukprot:TRINITY_DN9966_c2_g1_i1.p2 TRINITY_DN9966_c2_g1~~TRINITY_DN9966_c2_g1_i1.p2  ORF type:complete len:302 (+),score=76.39 TRINITY_DN9966_c2_g1_i1:80-907(+)
MLLQPTFAEEEFHRANSAALRRRPRAPRPRPPPRGRRTPAPPRRPVSAGAAAPRRRPSFGFVCSPTARETEGMDAACVTAAAGPAPSAIGPGISAAAVLGSLLTRAVMARQLPRTLYAVTAGARCTVDRTATVGAGAVLWRPDSGARVSVSAQLAQPRLHCGQWWWSLAPASPLSSLTLQLLIPPPSCAGSAAGGPRWVLPAVHSVHTPAAAAPGVSLGCAALPCDALWDSSCCGGAYAHHARACLGLEELPAIGQVLRAVLDRELHHWAVGAPP